MSDVLKPLHEAVSAWCHRAAASEWLPTNAAAVLDETVTGSPADLFGEGERPLVVALFGGTGVGKSTLMNRLAGETVARASAERPTSRDMTVYAPRGMAIDRLPDRLPMERVRTTLHNNAAWPNVLWLDMPDVDSVETGNRALVEQWLPHVDVLIYVVSPERYRDDEGWRLLLEHGANHAWIFVMNHWDRGDDRQFDDFNSVLVQAGLSDPLIYRTDSADPDGSLDLNLPRVDEFKQLAASVRTLAEQRLVEALQSRGILQRAHALRERGDALIGQLGDPTVLAGVIERWDAEWTREADALEEAFGWRIQVLAGDTEPAALFDADALERIDRSVEGFVQSAVDDGALPYAIARRTLDKTRGELRERLPRLVDDAVQQSLARPGGRWQRLAWKAAGVLSTVLPAAAVGWIGWRVLDAFRDGAVNPAAYLGSNFAINSALLMALAWFLPFFLQRKLAPSRASALAYGMQQGLSRALEEVRVSIGATLDDLGNEQRGLIEDQRAIWSADTAATALPGHVPEAVRRLVFAPATPALGQGAAVAGEAGVRASTQSSTDRAPLS